MKYLLFLLCVLLPFLHSYAREHTVADSLLQEMQPDAGKDSAIWKAYFKLTYQLALTDKEACMTAAEKGIRKAAQQKDSLTIGYLVQCKGLACNTRGQRDSAAYFYYQAAAIFERHRAEEKAASVYNDIARMNRKSGNLDRALFYYDKAMNIYERRNNEEGKAVIYNESGVVYEYKQDYEEAIRRYQLSLALQQKRKDQVGIGYSLEFLSGVYLKMKNFDLSEKYILEALAIRQELKDTFALAMNYTNLAEFYKEKGSPDKSVAYLKRSNDLATSIRYLDLMAHNYQQLAGIYKEQGDYPLAYETMQLHYHLKDSIYNLETSKQVEELSIKYETEKNKFLIQEQHFSILQRNYWLAGISSLLIGGSLLGYSFYRRNQLRQTARLQEIIMQQQEIATKAVMEAEETERQRIARDLHDGIGQMMSAAKMNLSALEPDLSFADEEQKWSFEKIIDLMDESCREIRSVSHNMTPNALLKNSLASAIRDFIDKLDKKALEVHLYTEGLDKRLDTNVEAVFYRIIQECVNNVIKHADADKLDISIINDGDGISTTIEDNGKGFDKTELHNFEGIGLKNIATRVNYLKGTLDIDALPGKGTLVAIHVPI